jgi:Plant transposon protein
LTPPAELWYSKEIRDIVEACLILHNMMVEHRVGNDKEESANLYTETNKQEATERNTILNSGLEREAIADATENPPPALDTALEASADKPKNNSMTPARLDHQLDRREHVPRTWVSGNSLGFEKIETNKQLKAAFVPARELWNDLYNEKEHFRLREAIVYELQDLVEENGQSA